MRCEHAKKRRLRRLHLISHMSHSDLCQLLLKEKPADAVLSIIELLFFFYRRKHFKIYSTQSAEFSKPSPWGEGGERNESDEGEIAPISLENKDATFPLESYWQSFVDPCVATLLALIAFAPLISIGFDYGLRPSLRMTHRGIYGANM